MSELAPVIINGVIIPSEQIYSQMQYHPAETFEDSRQQATTALVIKQLLLQTALKNKLLTKDDFENEEKVETAIDSLLNQEISVPDADQESCERYYQNNQQRFKDPKTQQVLSFQQVHQQIMHYLYMQSFQNAIAEYISSHIQSSEIVGFEFD